MTESMVTWFTEVSRSFYNKWGKEITDHPKSFYEKREFATQKEACDYARERSAKNHKADCHVLAKVVDETWWVYSYEKGRLAYHNENITWM